MARRSWILAALAATFLFLSSGCYHVRVVTTSVPQAETHQVWAHGFLYGLVGSEVNSAAWCGDRPVVVVDSYESVPNWLLTVLTAGIYTPRTVLITCAATTYQ